MSHILKHAEDLSDDELRQLVVAFRLSPEGAALTKSLKDEWQECIKYAEKRRKQNWSNRTISSTGSVQGLSKGKSRQERMKLPRLAELEIEKHYGLDWRSEKQAHDWAWKKFPQFRLVEK